MRDYILCGNVLDYTDSIVLLQNRNFLSLYSTDEVHDKREHSFTFNVKGIHAEASKVCFYYKKKTGFPHIKDYGFVDVAVSNKRAFGHTILLMSQVIEYLPFITVCSVDS